MPRRGAYSITPVAGYNVCWQAPAIGDEQVPLAARDQPCSLWEAGRLAAGSVSPASQFRRARRSGDRDCSGMNSGRMSAGGCWLRHRRGCGQRRDGLRRPDCLVGRADDDRADDVAGGVERHVQEGLVVGLSRHYGAGEVPPEPISGLDDEVPVSWRAQRRRCGDMRVGSATAP